MTEPLREAVRKVAEAALRDERIVGAVIAVAHRGETVMIEPFGLADREAGRPMMPDAIFRLASVSKPIVTAAVVALAEQGRVDLDGPVSTWLPEFRPRFGDTRPDITLRHLLTHTSGLSYPFREAPDGPYHRADISSGMDQPGLAAAEQLHRLAAVPLLFTPGTQWNYSLGVDVAALAAAAAAGTSLQELVADLVTDPLGMHDTAFSVTDIARLVQPYGVDASGRPVRMTDGYAGPTLTGTAARFHPSRILDPASYPSGGSGLAGTAGDVLAFIEALRRGGAPILGEAAARSMVTPQISAEIRDVLESGWSYALGTQVIAEPARITGPERPGAFKGSGGYGHSWFADPALETSVVALTTSAPEGVRGRLVTDVRQAVYTAVS